MFAAQDAKDVAHHQNRPIRVVVVADKRYLLPLTTCVRSMIDSAETKDILEVVVLTRGFSPVDSQNFIESLSLGRHTVTLVSTTVAMGNHTESRVHDHISDITYARLILDRFVPEDWDRCIYMDTDTLVRGSLSSLYFTTGLDIIAASPDPWTPTLSAPNGVQSWQALGLDPATRYFNAGVLLISLDKWRSEALSKRCLNFLDRNRDSIVQYDQEVLNALFSDSALLLAPKWNVTSYWQRENFLKYWSPDRDESSNKNVMKHAIIRHFEGPAKPWTTAPLSWPHVDEYFNVLDRTQWRGYRPAHHTVH